MKINIKILFIPFFLLIALCIGMITVNAESLETTQYKTSNNVRYYAPNGLEKYVLIKTQDTENAYKIIYTDNETHLYIKYSDTLYSSKNDEEITMIIKSFETEQQATDFLYKNSDIKSYEYETINNIKNCLNFKYVTGNREIGNTTYENINEYQYYKEWYFKTYNEYPPAKLESINEMGSEKIFNLLSNELISVIGVVLLIVISYIAIRKGINFIQAIIRGI